MGEYFVYIIRSLSRGTRYVGVSDDVQKRIKEHNEGRCRYTSGRRPWKLLREEKLGTLGEARRRENFLKSGQGRKWLDEFIVD